MSAWLPRRIPATPGQLLTRFGISARLVSLHEHNEAQRCDELLALLKTGSSIALVSDAGTPLISGSEGLSPAGCGTGQGRRDCRSVPYRAAVRADRGTIGCRPAHRPLSCSRGSCRLAARGTACRPHNCRELAGVRLPRWCSTRRAQHAGCRKPCRMRSTYSASRARLLSAANSPSCMKPSTAGVSVRCSLRCSLIRAASAANAPC